MNQLQKYGLLCDAMEGYGYAEFANDSMRNQVYYEKHGRYRASSYEQARRDYYLNEEHMTRCYLPGMYLPHLLWPRHNHITLIMAIEEAFGIRFTTREVMGFHNVGEMLTCLERKLPT